MRKFEDGLKLSIRGKIVGFLKQDMDSMVKTTMVIEREREREREIRHGGFKIWVLVTRRRRVSLLLVRERSRRLLFHEDFTDRAVTIRAKAR